METEKKDTTGEILTVNAEKISTLTGFTTAEIGVLKNTIAKGSTDTELAYFLSVCKSVQLNPFLKQIWFFKDKRGNLLIFAGRDGYLEIAQRDSRWTGMSSAYVCEKDNFTMDVPNGKVIHSYGIDRGKIVGAYCIIKPKGIETATVEWAEISEYKPKNASEYSPWSGQPGIMIQKVAEVHALKKAFGISGLNSEYDFQIVKDVAIPVQEVKAETEIEVQKKKIIEALATYDGEDKEEIKAMCIEKSQANEFTPEFAQSIANQISLEL
jgi:phage recombination protein Bet